MVDEKAQICAELWVLLFKKHIRDIMYLAEMAEIKTQITADYSALNLVIHGFNDSMDSYLIDLFYKIDSFNIENFKDLFERVKQGDIATRSDILKKSPYRRVAFINTVKL